MAIADHLIDGTLSERSQTDMKFDVFEHAIFQRVIEDILGVKRSRRHMRRQQRRRGAYTFVVNYEDNCDMLTSWHFIKKYRTSRLVLETDNTVVTLERLRRVLHSFCARRNITLGCVIERQNYNGTPYFIYTVTY